MKSPTPCLGHRIDLNGRGIIEEGGVEWSGGMSGRVEF